MSNGTYQRDVPSVKMCLEMKITPEIKKELKRVLWDYAIDESTLCAIFEGKEATFSLNRDKLCARLLLSTSWYRLLDCLGLNGLKEILTEEAINLIWIKDIRERFIYARKVLQGVSCLDSYPRIFVKET